LAYLYAEPRASRSSQFESEVIISETPEISEAEDPFAKRIAISIA